MLLKLSTGLKFRGFQSWNFVEVKFAVGKKSWYSQKLNFATWQKIAKPQNFPPAKISDKVKGIWWKSQALL